MAHLFNADAMTRTMKDMMVASAVEAAEPLVQEAVAKAERKIRAAIVEGVTAQIDHAYHCEYHRDHFVITFRTDGGGMK